MRDRERDKDRERQRERQRERERDRQTDRDRERAATTGPDPLRLTTDCQLRDFSSVLLYVHGDHKDYQGREPRTATSTFTQLLSSAEFGRKVSQ